MRKKSDLKNIAGFSVPYFVSYFLQTPYGMADLFIIGRFDGCFARVGQIRRGGNIHSVFRRCDRRIEERGGRRSGRSLPRTDDVRTGKRFGN